MLAWASKQESLEGSAREKDAEEETRRTSTESNVPSACCILVETDHLFNPYFQESHNSSIQIDNKEVLLLLLKPPFTPGSHQHKASPEKGIGSTVTALTTVEEHGFQYGSCWSTAVRITHSYSLSAHPGSSNTKPFQHAALQPCCTWHIWFL